MSKTLSLSVLFGVPDLPAALHLPPAVIPQNNVHPLRGHCCIGHRARSKTNYSTEPNTEALSQCSVDARSCPEPKAMVSDLQPQATRPATQNQSTSQHHYQKKIYSLSVLVGNPDLAETSAKQSYVHFLRGDCVGSSYPLATDHVDSGHSSLACQPPPLGLSCSRNTKRAVHVSISPPKQLLDVLFRSLLILHRQTFKQAHTIHQSLVVLMQEAFEIWALRHSNEP